MSNESPSARDAACLKRMINCRAGMACVLLLLAADCVRVSDTQPAAEFEPLKDLGQTIRVPSGVHLSIPAEFTMTDQFDPRYALAYVTQEGRTYSRGVVEGWADGVSRGLNVAGSDARV